VRLQHLSSVLCVLTWPCMPDIASACSCSFSTSVSSITCRGVWMNRGCNTTRAEESAGAEGAEESVGEGDINAVAPAHSKQHTPAPQCWQYYGQQMQCSITPQDDADRQRRTIARYCSCKQSGWPAPAETLDVSALRAAWHRLTKQATAHLAYCCQHVSMLCLPIAQMLLCVCTRAAAVCTASTS
jgi:hypothetical protein